MPAFNIVRFRVKPGNASLFIETHRELRPKFKGFLGGNLVRTGEHTFCIIGQWRNFDSLTAARPQMIGMLDRMRDMLEDLGGDLGVTDPVSGESVLRLAPSKPVRKATKGKATKSKSGKRKSASKRAKKKSR